MISTKIRLQLEEICVRIQNKKEVSLSEMVLIEKYAKVNRTVFDMLQKARRRSVQGVIQEGSPEEFLDQMNLGNPDPTTHITGQSNIDDIVDFFRNDTDHMRRD